MRIIILLILTLLSSRFLFSESLAWAKEPIGLAAYTLNKPGSDWVTRSSGHFQIHYLPASRAESEIDVLLEQNEAILASHLATLGVERYDKTIDLFYFDSRNQISEIVSKPFRALADAASMTVLTIRNNEEIGRDAHEIMHVVSFDLWGGWEDRIELAWLSEGLATFADKPCNGYEMSELAAHILMNTEDAVPLDSLATNFRQYPEMIGYVLMASFVGFIVDTYGIERLHQLWVENYPNFEKVFGGDLATFEQKWRQYMDSNYPDPKVPDWNDLKEHGCK